jgi:hypothetical protein
MISNVISWTEVIKRRHMKEIETELSPAESEPSPVETEPSRVESDGTDAVIDDQYISATDNCSVSRSEENRGNEFNDNIIRNTYPYLGTNQTIECQIISG